jgi:hypothetical protein
MEENMEFKLEIDLKPNGKVESFHNKEEFQKWLKIEVDFWNWGVVLREARDQQAEIYLNSLNSKIRSIQESFNNTINEIDSNNFRNRLEQLKNLVSKYYNNKQLLHSSAPISKFIKDVKEKEPVRALYMLKYFIERRFDYNDKAEFEGAFAVLLFEAGIKGAGKAEKDALLELRSLWQAHLNDSKSELNKIKEQYNDLLKEYTSQKEGQSKVFGRLVEAVTKEHKEVLDKTGKDLDDLRDLYKSKLGLHASIVYWEDKAKSHLKFVWGSTIAVLVCFGLAGWGLNTIINKFIGEETIQNIKFWKLSILILGATVGVWVLRVLIRLLLSNYHLMSDAKERRTMLLTYLALQQENKLPQGDTVNLILQALFRPASMGIIKDDAAPPFMAAWLKQITGD